MTDRYGAKGCLCFYDEDGAGASGRWMPNARCPHHGLLADFTDRRETGTYRVIKVEPEDRTVRPMPEPGDDCEACAQYGECLDCQQAREEGCSCLPGEGPCRCTELDESLKDYNAPMPPDVARAMLPPSAFGLDVPDAGPADCNWGKPFACRVHCPLPVAPEATRDFVDTYARHDWVERPRKKDRGLFAAVRRWFSYWWDYAYGRPRS